MEGWEVFMAPQPLSQEMLQCIHPPPTPQIQIEPIPAAPAYRHSNEPGLRDLLSYSSHIKSTKPF